MENKNFNDYYQDIRERDQKIYEEKPLPQPQGHSVWNIFGLALGISAIVFSIFTKYSIICAGLALIFSIIGYIKEKHPIGIVAIVCSSIGLISGIIFTVTKFMLLQKYF